MRLIPSVVALFVSASIGTFGQHASRPTADQSRDVAAVQTAAIAALNFRQGDAPGFDRARSEFTASGWQEFTKTMRAFLDDRGAPTFTSTFVARETKVLGDRDGVMHLKIPGTLTQSNQRGKTTYQRFAIEVYATRDPAADRVRIQRLEQVTCVGASTACN